MSVISLWKISRKNTKEIEIEKTRGNCLCVLWNAKIYLKSLDCVCSRVGSFSFRNETIGKGFEVIRTDEVKSSQSKRLETTQNQKKKVCLDVANVVWKKKWNLEFRRIWVIFICLLLFSDHTTLDLQKLTFVRDMNQGGRSRTEKMWNKG